MSQLAAGSTHIRDGLNRISRRRWNPQHQIIESTDTLGHTWQFEWNDERQWLGATDPDGGQWRFSYDETGNLSETRDPLGQTESTLWLEHWSLPQSETDKAGGHWQYRYDPRGNCISETDPLGHSTGYRYDDQGQVLEITDAAGRNKQLRWSETGQLLEYTDCSGYATHYAYDRRGYLRSITDALGEQTAFEHDAQGRLLRSELPDGRVEQFQRDSSGQLTGYIDPAGHTTRYGYNRRGQVRQRIDPLGHRAQFDYDAYGRLQTLSNENDERYRFAWDAADRLIEQQDLDGSAQRYAYDNRDNLIGLTHLPAPHGGGLSLVPEQPLPPLVQTFERDALGRLVAKITADGLTAYRYTPLDLLTEVSFTGGDGQTQKLGFAYDALGQMREQHSSAGTLQHEYGELGNLIRTGLPDGRWLNQLYYGSGHLHQINLDGQVISDFKRDRLHREILRTQGRITTRSQYDRAGRLLDRPLSGAGYVSNNQILTYQDKRYRYDAFGRTVEKRSTRHGVQRFAYDAEHRLTEIHNDNGHVLRMHYDPLGRRIAKTEHDRHGHLLGETRFTWDGLRLLQEQKNSLTSLYVYLEDSYEPLARVDGRGDQQRVRYYHNDLNGLNGLPEQLTDSEGQTVWQAQYQVWGNTLREVREPYYVEEQNLRFQGQYLG